MYVLSQNLVLRRDLHMAGDARIDVFSLVLGHAQPRPFVNVSNEDCVVGGTSSECTTFFAKKKIEIGSTPRKI